MTLWNPADNSYQNGDESKGNEEEIAESGSLLLYVLTNVER